MGIWSWAKLLWLLRAIAAYLPGFGALARKIGAEKPSSRGLGRRVPPIRTYNSAVNSRAT